MDKLIKLRTIKDVNAFIHEETLAFLYLSKPTCSVCHGLLPQVQHLMKNYPIIQMAHIDTEEVPEIAGAYSIFTVPVLLLFVNGKEYIREARIVHLDLLAKKLNKIYENVKE